MEFSIAVKICAKLSKIQGRKAVLIALKHQEFHTSL
jgi:hypothetical protein